jgi:hypothetical protein
MPNSKRTSQTVEQMSGSIVAELGGTDESAQAEDIDHLLLSSLRFWEVEHDLIDERIAQLGR